jgi:hypothetical protein
MMAGCVFRRLNSCLFRTHVEQAVVWQFFSLTVEDEESSILSKVSNHYGTVSLAGYLIC